MSLAVCPGSFDPVTHGHLDVVARAAAVFGEVVVVVVTNPAKAGTFAPAERVALLQEALRERGGLAGVRVEVLGGGLLAEHCARLGAAAIVKGVRGAADVEHEAPMAAMNRHLTGVETVLLTADPRWAHLSSSLVKEVASLGGDVRSLVPDAVLAALGRAVGEGAAPPTGAGAPREAAPHGPTG